MTAIVSVPSFSNLKYGDIFDYIEDTVRIRTNYARIAYFLKGI